MTIMICRSYISCGVRQIYNIEGWNKIYFDEPGLFIKEFYNGSYDPAWGRKFKFAIFSHRSNGSEVGGTQTCKKIKEFIETNNLGKVMESDTEKNPNSGNDIQIYIWNINWPAVEKFMADTKLKQAASFVWKTFATISTAG